MYLELEKCVVRSWIMEDAESIARHANDRDISINLRDVFPHPYTLEDANNFLLFATGMAPETYYAIEVSGKAVGAVGLILGEDVERCTAEIGYWLGKSFWGRGIATCALMGMTAYALDAFNLVRVFAKPFAWNEASCRVLEKAGYAYETRLRGSAVKDNIYVDQLLYAYIDEHKLMRTTPKSRISARFAARIG